MSFSRYKLIVTIITILGVIRPSHEQGQAARPIPRCGPSIIGQSQGQGQAGDEQSLIQCSLHLDQSRLNDGSDSARVECVENSKDVYVIHGEYTQFIINCSAPFPLDLEYDGFRPTEAVGMSLWKEVEVRDETRTGNSTPGESENHPESVSVHVISHGLTVTITSVQTLYEIFQEEVKRDRDLSSSMGPGQRALPVYVNGNWNSPIVYSRTGRFRIRPMHKVKGQRNLDVNSTDFITPEFYLFFHEPLMTGRIDWIENEHTTRVTFDRIPETEENRIRIPCRPSHHLTSDVTLSFNRNVNVSATDLSHPNSTVTFNGTWTPILTKNLTYDPTTGFLLPSSVLDITEENLNEFIFQCSAKVNDEVTVKSKVFSSLGDRTTSIFGLNHPSLIGHRPDLGREIRIQNHVSVTGTEVTSFLRCFLDRPPEPGDLFYTYGRPQSTMLEMRYSRALVLPAFINLGYWVQRWETAPLIVDIFIQRANPHGAAFCRKGNLYKFEEYASGLNSKEITYSAGKNWVDSPRRTTTDPVQIRLLRIQPAPETTPDYTHMEHTFHCHNAGFYFTRPILWFLKFANGTQKLVFKDDLQLTSSSQTFSILKINLTVEAVELSCVKFLWSYNGLGEIPRREWKTASMKLELVDGNPPTILSPGGLKSFSAGGGQRRLDCEASGVPSPQVWWERQKKGQTAGDENSDKHVELTRRSRNQTVSLDLDKLEEVDKGKDNENGERALTVWDYDYICKTENPYGRRERLFRVEETPRGVSFYLLSIGLPIFVFVFLLIILGLFLYYREQLKRTRLTVAELRDFKEGIKGGEGIKGATRASQSPLVPLALPYRVNEYEISEDDFKIDEKSVLGSGAFGLVRKAQVNGEEVAVKTVKLGADKSHLMSLLSELKILQYLGPHPHLICLVGANTSQLERGMVFVFVQLCAHGNLLSFLEDHREKFIRIDMNSNFNPNPNYQNENKVTFPAETFKIGQLHQWALQIAQGMAYLTEMRVIHGDLAARNVLITGDLKMKITDFGLSRQLQSSKIYSKKSQGPLPFRWMALESLSDLRFSTQSDVWSYGVTLWEMYSLGQVPHAAECWSPAFIKKLENGTRLSCPSFLPKRIFSMALLPCWESEPDSRPSFERLTKIWEAFLNSTEANPNPTGSESELMSVDSESHRAHQPSNNGEMGRVYANQTRSDMSQRYTLEPRNPSINLPAMPETILEDYENLENVVEATNSSTLTKAKTTANLIKTPVSRDSRAPYANVPDKDQLESVQTQGGNLYKNQPAARAVKRQNPKDDDDCIYANANPNFNVETNQNDQNIRMNAVKSMNVEFELAEIQKKYVNL